MPPASPRRTPPDRPLTLRPGDGRTLAVPLLVALALLYVVGLNQPPLLERDETRYVAIAQEMVRSGDYVTGRINGFVYLAKPPLLFWLTAAALRVGGLEAAAERLPCVLVGLVGLVLVALPGARLVGRRAATLATLVLGTSLMYLGVARMVRFDLLVTVPVCTTLLLFWIGLSAPERRWYWVGAGPCLALGTLAKGPVAVVLAGGVIVPYLLWTRQPRELLRVQWVYAVGLWALLAAPWFVAAERANPGFLRYFIVSENLGRAAAPGADMHPEPWWLLIAALIGGSLPWTAFLPAAGRLAGRQFRATDASGQRPVPFLLLWMLFPLALFSASSGKLLTYVVPCLPPLALLIGLTVDRALDSPGARGARTLALASAIPLMALAVGALLAAALQTHFPREAALTAAFAFCVALLVPGVVAAVAAAAGRPLLALCALGAAGYLPVLVAGRVTPLAVAETEGRPVADLVRAHRQPGEALASWAGFPRFLVLYGFQPVYVIDRFPPSDYNFPANDPRLPEMVFPRERPAAFFDRHPRALIVAKQRNLAELQAAVPDLRPVGETRFWVVLRHGPDGATGGGP